LHFAVKFTANLMANWCLSGVACNLRNDDPRPIQTSITIMITKSIAILVATAGCTSMLNAALSAEVTQFNQNQLSMSITGSIDAGATIGGSDGNALFMGSPSLDLGWIQQSGSIGSSTSNGGGQTINLTSASYENTADGDFIRIFGDDVFAIGDIVNALVSFSTGTSDPFIPGNVTVDDMIISAGSESNFASLPDIRTQVGTATLVPEPSHYSALAGLVIAAAIIYTRRRKS